MRTARWLVMSGSILAGLALSLSIGDGAEPKQLGPDPKKWEGLVDKAIDYLKTSQAEDGSWSGKRSPGVTGIVLTGILRTGRVKAEDPVAAKALSYIELLVNPKAGHIAGKDPAPQLQNYVTSVNLMALVEAKREDKYKKIIGDATTFLKKLQWDEEEGKNPSDDFYGGAGYDSKSRPDLSNTQMFLDALKAAGGGNSKVEGSSPEVGLLGYGSMTYAGIKSMIYCGVSKDDPRVKKAYEWIQKHYTVDANPGMPKVQAHRGLFYYYHTMAKCLNALGIDEVVDAEGKKHDWRADITEALAKRQKADGSWVNDKDQWMEGDPNLVTGYALMALSYCKPRK